MPEKQQHGVNNSSSQENEKNSNTAAAAGGGGAGGVKRGGGAGGGDRQYHTAEKGSSSSTAKPQRREDEEGEDAEQEAFDEPDDELEEFDIIGGDQSVIDLEVAQWDEDWDAAGWDDEDVNDDFIKRLQQELEAFKQAHLAKQQQQQQVKIG